MPDCDAVVIGAGSGLSTAAGFNYAGERIEKYFSDFAGKYGFQDMYSGGFYPFAAPEEHWAYWSRYIYNQLWQMTAGNPKAIYACINQGQAVCPQEIERRSICIDGDIGSALEVI